MLARLVRGWGGKLFVLVLLGFAVTDFVITKTLSAADAAEHLIHNPFWGKMPPWVLQIGEPKQQLFLTMFTKLKHLQLVDASLCLTLHLFCVKLGSQLLVQPGTSISLTDISCLQRIHQ